MSILADRRNDMIANGLSHNPIIISNKEYIEEDIDEIIKICNKLKKEINKKSFKKGVKCCLHIILSYKNEITDLINDIEMRSISEIIPLTLTNDDIEEYYKEK